GDEDEGGLELGGEAEDGSGVSCGAAAPRSEPPPAPPPGPVDGAEAGGAADFVLPTPPLVPRPGVPVAPAAAGVPPSPEPDVPLPPEAPWPWCARSARSPSTWIAPVMKSCQMSAGNVPPNTGFPLKSVVI